VTKGSRHRHARGHFTAVKRDAVLGNQSQGAVQCTLDAKHFTAIGAGEHLANTLFATLTPHHDVRLRNESTQLGRFKQERSDGEDWANGETRSLN
jgi:hypothetical protein